MRALSFCRAPLEHAMLLTTLPEGLLWTCTTPPQCRCPSSLMFRAGAIATTRTRTIKTTVRKSRSARAQTGTQTPLLSSRASPSSMARKASCAIGATPLRSSRRRATSWRLHTACSTVICPPRSSWTGSRCGCALRAVSLPSTHLGEALKSPCCAGVADYEVMCGLSSMHLATHASQAHSTRAFGHADLLASLTCSLSDIPACAWTYVYSTRHLLPPLSPPLLLQASVMRHTGLPPPVVAAIDALPCDAHPMGVLITGMCALSTVHPEQNPAMAGQQVYRTREVQDKQIARLLGKVGESSHVCVFTCVACCMQLLVVRASTRWPVCFAKGACYMSRACRQ